MKFQFSIFLSCVDEYRASQQSKSIYVIWVFIFYSIFYRTFLKLKFIWILWKIINFETFSQFHWLYIYEISHLLDLKLLWIPSNSSHYIHYWFQQRNEYSLLFFRITTISVISLTKTLLLNSWMRKYFKIFISIWQFNQTHFIFQTKNLFKTVLDEVF